VRAVRLSYGHRGNENTTARHRQFIDAIENQILHCCVAEGGLRFVELYVTDVKDSKSTWKHHTTSWLNVEASCISFTPSLIEWEKTVVKNLWRFSSFFDNSDPGRADAATKHHGMRTSCRRTWKPPWCPASYYVAVEDFLSLIATLLHGFRLTILLHVKKGIQWAFVSFSWSSHKGYCSLAHDLKNSRRQYFFKDGQECRFKELNLLQQVNGNYMYYVKWKFLHQVFCHALQVLATLAMFWALGIGHSCSLPSAAVLYWVLKDGLGRVSRCIYTAGLASAFDINLKRVKSSTSVMFSLSIGVELLTPAFPTVLLASCICC
jgi:hypothetical protein